MKLHAVLVALAAAVPAVAQTPRLVTVSPADDQLRTIDPATGATLSQIQLTIPGPFAIVQGNGLATDPTNGDLYGMVSVNIGGGTKNLIKIDPDTGACVDFGDTLEKFAGIAFDSSGQMWGVSGDGGILSETLYKIDKTNGALTVITPLGHGGAGEALEFNPFDGLLYHASGNGLINDLVTGTILETIDPTTLAIQPITLSGPYAPIGLLSLGRSDAGTLLSQDFAQNFVTVSTSGVVTAHGFMDHLVKGFAWVNGPSFFQSYGQGCPGSGAFTPTLTGSGTPNPAQSFTLNIANALGGAQAVLFVGLGQGTANLVPSCALQVMPILPQLIIPLPIFGSGPGNGFLPLPATLPGNLPTLDVFVQVVIADSGAAGGIASTKPLRIHIQ